MQGIQSAARTRMHRNAVVAIVVHPYLRHATALASGTFNMVGGYAFDPPERKAHAAEVIVTNTGDKCHACALAGSRYSSIAALAARTDSEG